MLGKTSGSSARLGVAKGWTKRWPPKDSGILGSIIPREGEEGKLGTPQKVQGRFNLRLTTTGQLRVILGYPKPEKPGRNQWGVTKMEHRMCEEKVREPG